MNNHGFLIGRKIIVFMISPFLLLRSIPLSIHMNPSTPCLYILLHDLHHINIRFLFSENRHPPFYQPLLRYRLLHFINPS
jgi:hypothetical protein